MALRGAVIKRDSVSLLAVHFLNSVQVFLCEISSACLLKYPYSCFSSYFGFLVIVFYLYVVSAGIIIIIIIIIGLSHFFE